MWWLFLFGIIPTHSEYPWQQKTQVFQEFSKQRLRSRENVAKFSYNCALHSNKATNPTSTDSHGNFAD